MARTNDSKIRRAQINNLYALFGDVKNEDFDKCYWQAALCAECVLLLSPHTPRIVRKYPIVIRTPDLS